MNAFAPPRPFPRLLLEMTGNQGAVLLCAFVPPRPCPRLLLQMRGAQGSAFVCVCAEKHERFRPPPAPAQDYVQGALLPMTGDQGAVLLCVQRNMNAFVRPPRPCPRLCSGCTWADDRR